MAAAPPPIIAAPAAPVSRSYRAFYDDAANDPYSGHYEAIIARFRAVPVAPAVAAAPADLAESVYDITRRPGPAFLLYCRPAFDPMGTAAPRIRLFHRLGKYGGEIGLPTVWDGIAFAFVGDVVPPQSDITSVVWAQNYFHQTAVMRVQHQDAFNQALLADPAAVLFGPFGPGDAAITDTYRVRNAAYVPHKYVNLFLGQDLPPRTAYEIAFAAIEADGLTDTLSDLLFWLRATMTCQVVGADSPLIYPHPPAPPPDANLIGDRRHRLFTDLPALSQGAVGQGAELIAGAVGTLVEQNRQFRDADEERKAGDVKTPDSFLGSAVQSLLRIAQVATAADLPQLWQDLARATKKAHQRNIIQMAMDEALNQVSPGGGRAYIVTPSVANKIVGLEYRMANPDALTTGLQPFILTQTSSGAREAAQSRVSIYDTVMGGGASASVSDAESLVSNDPAVLPRTFLQARASLTVFEAFLLATLGEEHTWTRALHRFLLRMNSREMELEELQTRDPHYRNLVPTLVVRWIQLRWDDWLQTQWYGLVDQPAPELTSLFSDIRIGTAWEPTIPAQYLRLQQPPSVATVSPAAPIATSSTSGPQLRNQPAAGSREGTIIRNTAWSETDFGVYRAIPSIKVRELYIATAETPTPVSSYDSPATRQRPATPLRMCLSYHVKAMCNTRCGRAGDHQPLTPDKRQELLAWCGAHYAATPAAAT
jgi:hypothetical protein